MRFDPPAVPLPSEASAALDLAFGPVEKERRSPTGQDARVVVEQARSLKLSGRIGARWGAGALAHRLGRDAAESCLEDVRLNAMAEVCSEAVAVSIADAASGLDMPVVFLKGTALAMNGVTLPGSRGLADVDVLAPRGRAAELQAELKAQGCSEPVDLPHGEHQLQILAHPLGLAVEVHVCLVGVRENRRASMTFADLDRLGLTRKIDHFPGDARLPVRRLLLAHAVAHGLAQHGLNPRAYPMLRFLTDLVDLDLRGALADGSAAEWMTWTAGDVPDREVVAVADLCRRLTAGEGAADIWEGGGDAGALLRHLVLGVTDREYQDSLRIRSLVSVPPSGDRATTLWKIVRDTTFLTRGQVEAMYGRPKTSLGYLGFRLYRPLQLVGKVLRYGLAAVKGRIRRG